MEEPGGSRCFLGSRMFPGFLEEDVRMFTIEPETQQSGKDGRKERKKGGGREGLRLSQSGADLCWPMNVCCCAESKGIAQSDCWPYAYQTGSSPPLTGREPRDALTPVDPPHLRWGDQSLTGDTADAWTSLQTGERQTGVWTGEQGVCTGV